MKAQRAAKLHQDIRHATHESNRFENVLNSSIENEGERLQKWG